jgi:FAD:protein FMN transferase
MHTYSRHVHVEHVMGTAVAIDVRGCAPPPQAIHSAVRWLHDVDATFSTYRPDSAVRRLDRGELELTDASQDVRWVIGQCERLRRQTGGFFDARVTGTLDPSAFVKGWAVQRAADRLRADGVTDFCLTAGGRRRDARPRGRRQRLASRHPASARPALDRDRRAGPRRLRHRDIGRVRAR